MPHHSLSSPSVRMTTQATSKLPRWILIFLCVLYIIPGLLYRDPWGSDDVVGVAQMMTLAKLPLGQWLAPQAFGVAIEQEGPLAFWIGAIFVKVFSDLLSPITAARLSNIMWFTILCTCVWYSTYFLGKRTEAQPIALPFGGQPSPSDYGRMLADAALLMLLATLGLLWRSHESSAEIAMLALQASTFFACVIILEHPRRGASLLGLSLAGLFLARGLPNLIPMILAVTLCIITKKIPYRVFLGISLPIFLSISITWFGLTQAFFPTWITHWWAWHQDILGLITLHGLSVVLKNIPWFLWPSFPLALFSLHRWRGFYHSPHIHLPLVFLGSTFLMLFFIQRPADAEGLSLIIPSAILAAMALPTMRRGLINAIDWFALMCFSFVLCLIWFGWLAVTTGVPMQIAKNFEKQTLGFLFEFSWLTLLSSLVITSFWIAVVCWRIYTKPSALWRGTVLSASGLLCCWLIALSFFLPAANYSKSYRSLSDQLATAVTLLPDPTCIKTDGITLSQRAAFGVFNGIQLPHAPSCTRPAVLIYADRSLLEKKLTRYPNYKVIWESRRAADRRERIVLLKPI